MRKHKFLNSDGDEVSETEYYKPFFEQARQEHEHIQNVVLPAKRRAEYFEKNSAYF